MFQFVHDTAKVDPTAELGYGVVIGPNVVVGARARIGAYSVIGGLPESLGFYGRMDQTLGVRIGPGAHIFEHVTIHAGTRNSTMIGPSASVFNHSHIAHDCIVYETAIVGGHTTLAGHVLVMPGAVVSGNSAVHQWSVVGAYAFLAGSSFLKGHVPPGEKWIGNPARPAGLNEIGLSRNMMTIEMCRERHRTDFDRIIKERTI